MVFVFVFVFVLFVFLFLFLCLCLFLFLFCVFVFVFVFVMSHVSPGAEEGCCVTCFVCSRRCMLCHMFRLGLKKAVVSHVSSVGKTPKENPPKSSPQKFHRKVPQK